MSTTKGDCRTEYYFLSAITVRGGELIGYSVIKPSLGEEAAFMVQQHGSADIAKRHARNLCDKLNGTDDWDRDVMA